MTRLALVVVVALAVAGCFDPFTDAPRTCTADTDCLAGETCIVVADLGQCVSDDVDVVLPRPPRVLGARFTPAITNGDSALVVVDVNEAVDDAAVVLAFDIDGVTTSRAATSVPTEPHVLLDVSALGDGSVALLSAAVVDDEGLAGAAAIANAVLTIDRTPPALTATARPAAGPRFAVEAGVDVEVVADEDLAAIAARIGDIEATCTSSTPRRHRCSFASGATVHGRNAIVVGAVDVADNAIDVDLAIDVDGAAPAAVAPAVVALSDRRGRGVGSVVNGGTVVVTTVFDEAPAAPPTFSLREGAAVVATTTAVVSGVIVVATFNDVAVAGVSTLAVALDDVVDDLGHAAALVPVALAAPYEAGLPVAAAGAPPCAPLVAGGCVDADGDGVVAETTGCDAALFDFDDGDPRAGPTIPEVPGDGVDNDGVGGDAVLDDSTAVFVADTGDVFGTGSAADPFDAFDVAAVHAAAALAQASGRALAIRGRIPCDQFLEGDRLIEAPIVVGVDGAFLSQCEIVADAAVGIDADVIVVDAYAADSEASFATFAAGAIFVDVDVEFLEGGGGTVVGGHTDFALVTATRFVRASVDELRAEGAVHIVASVVRERLALAGADALVVHSRLRSLSGPAVIESTTSRLRLIGSIVEATADPDLGPASVQVGRVRVSADATLFAPGLATVCDFDGCVDDPAAFGLGNNRVAVPADLDGIHLVGVVSPAVGVVLNPFDLGAPPQAIADVDGACLTLPAAAGPDQP